MALPARGISTVLDRQTCKELIEHRIIALLVAMPWCADVHRLKRWPIRVALIKLRVSAISGFAQTEQYLIERAGLMDFPSP